MDTLMALAADMAAHEGLITEEDLAAYEPLTRPPVTGVYRSWEVLSAPPSTSSWPRSWAGSVAPSRK